MRELMTARATLPEDGAAGTLIGRAFVPAVAGPSVVVARADGVYDITAAAPTVSELIDGDDPVAVAQGAGGERLGSLDELLANTPPETRDATRPWLLAPVDLQAVKAAGVTFVVSLLERVIEEQAKGDPARADAIRARITDILGSDLRAVRPGSPEARRLKEHLIEEGAWSQYLEVGIGPDAEIFTKAPPMAAVGTGVEIGIHPVSSWNNPEPEVVLAIDSRGRIKGATLGNDVNLRDVEGRSALLLGKAKDNNASCALGPFLRLIDDTFSLDDIRSAEVRLEVRGEDGFTLKGHSSMSAIARDIEDLAAQAIGPHHQYPDGLVLMLGTMFAPIEDRDAEGRGFTHKEGDVVVIASSRLGLLVDRVRPTDRVAPWTFGAGALMRNLAARGLL
jgi:fumarylacetoacetate (FAA) hydrolase family protein